MVLFFFTLDHIFQKKKKSRVFIYTNNKQNKRVNKKKKKKQQILGARNHRERKNETIFSCKNTGKKNIQEQNDCLLFTFFFGPIQWLFIKRCNWGNFSRSQLI